MYNRDLVIKLKIKF